MYYAELLVERINVERIKKHIRLVSNILPPWRQMLT